MRPVFSGFIRPEKRIRARPRHQRSIDEFFAANVDPRSSTPGIYFDKETGLIARRVVTTETPIGVDSEQTEYEDYREVDGVKVAHTIRTSYLDNFYSSTRKFTEIKHNAQVDEVQFKMPELK